MDVLIWNIIKNKQQNDKSKLQFSCVYRRWRKSNFLKTKKYTQGIYAKWVIEYAVTPMLIDKHSIIYNVFLYESYIECNHKLLLYIFPVWIFHCIYFVIYRFHGFQFLILSFIFWNQTNFFSFFYRYPLSSNFSSYLKKIFLYRMKRIKKARLQFSENYGIFLFYFNIEIFKWTSWIFLCYYDYYYYYFFMHFVCYFLVRWILEAIILVCDVISNCIKEDSESKQNVRHCRCFTLQKKNKKKNAHIHDFQMITLLRCSLCNHSLKHNVYVYFYIIFKSFLFVRCILFRLKMYVTLSYNEMYEIIGCKFCWTHDISNEIRYIYKLIVI